MFIDKEVLKEEVNRCFALGKMSETLAGYFLLMAREMSKKFVYKNPDDKEDCIGFALVEVVRYWKHSYDPAKCIYPFSYYTQMLKNGFAKGWHKLHPQSASMVIPLIYENNQGGD